MGRDELDSARAAKDTLPELIEDLGLAYGVLDSEVEVLNRVLVLPTPAHRQLEERALAGAVRSDEPDDLPRRDGEGAVRQRPRAPVALAEALCLTAAVTLRLRWAWPSLRWALRCVRLAEEIEAAYGPAPTLAVVAVAGSVGAGYADRWSDVEIDCYWREPPSEEDRLEPIRALEGELKAYWEYDERDREWSEEYQLRGLMVTESNFTVATVEELLSAVLEAGDLDPAKHYRLAARAARVSPRPSPRPSRARARRRCVGARWSCGSGG